MAYGKMKPAAKKAAKKKPVVKSKTNKSKKK